MKQALVDAFDARNRMTKDDIPQMLAMLQKNEAAADMDLVAAESMFKAMEAYYKVRWMTTSYDVLTHLEVSMKLFVDIRCILGVSSCSERLLLGGNLDPMRVYA